MLLTPLAPMVAFPHSHGAAIRYDPFKDFEPVAHLCDFQLALLVNAELPAKSVADYVALVKKDPDSGDYASAAAGSLPHYVGVMFARTTGTRDDAHFLQGHGAGAAGARRRGGEERRCSCSPTR